MSALFSPRFTLCILGALFFYSLQGMSNYAGSASVFLLFNVTWLTACYLALTRDTTFTHFFITGMLFLGFWAKLTLLLTKGFMFGDPTGNFFKHPTPALWDRALLVSTLPAATLILMQALFPRWPLKKTGAALNETFLQFYKTHRHTCWLILFASTLSLNGLNYIIGFFQASLPPKMILPLHLNALLPWLLIFVTPLAFALLFDLDRKTECTSSKWYVALFIFSAALTSTIALSRGIFVFWITPFLLVYLRKQNLSLMLENKLLLFLLFSFFAASFTLVGHLRQHTYAQHNKAGGTQLAADHQGTGKWFFIERWIGIEGVLSTTAYQHAGKQLLLDGIRQKVSPEHPAGFYTPTIAPPRFPAFYLPGLTGFLNYSHSLPLIFAGLLSVFTLLQLAERWAWYIFSSPLYCARLGIFMAYWFVSGFNIPYLGLVNFIEILSAGIALWAGMKLTTVACELKNRQAQLTAS